MHHNNNLKQPDGIPPPRNLRPRLPQASIQIPKILEENTHQMTKPLNTYPLHPAQLQPCMELGGSLLTATYKHHTQHNNASLQNEIGDDEDTESIQMYP